MQWIEYDYVCNQGKGIVFHKKVEYNEVNLAVAKREAVNGAYFITEDEDAQARDPLAVEFGGTGARNVSDARKNLEVAQAIESTGYPGCYHRVVGGKEEWINPPMEPGVEYRTTERFAGRPVYTTIVSGQAGKAIIGTFGVNFATSTGSVDMVLRWNGWTKNGIVLPSSLHAPDSNDHRRVEVKKSDISADAILCTCYAGKSAIDSNETWYIQLWYVKIEALAPPIVGG